MGRFSSVQAYADNNSSIRKVSYEQATARSADNDGSDKHGIIKANVKPEKVVNPYGSTAGAGSGEFHLYRHGRNREMQRLHRMDVEARVQAANEAFQKELADNEQWSESRTAKRRRKREKQKEAKRRKQNLKKNGIDITANDTSGPTIAVHDGTSSSEGNAEDEFTYIPGAAVAPLEEQVEDKFDVDGFSAGRDNDDNAVTAEESVLESERIEKSPGIKPVE